MIEAWITFDLATGAPRLPGSGPIGAMEQQRPNLPEGIGIMLAPAAAFYSDPIDLTMIKLMRSTEIDDGANAERSKFITGGDWQMATYMRKEVQARAYVASSSASVPLLDREARARSMTVPQLAAEVITKADSWALIGDKIEVARVAAKQNLRDATNLAEIAAALSIDWSAVSGS